MKMETETDKNRVGIYTQVSAEATAVGEGLAPQGEKSPVATNNGNPSDANEMQPDAEMNMNTNQSQCSNNVGKSEASNTDDQAENTTVDESLAPQGEKSPVATNNGNSSDANETQPDAEINTNTNQSQCSDNVGKSEASNTDDQAETTTVDQDLDPRVEKPTSPTKNANKNEKKAAAAIKINTNQSQCSDASQSQVSKTDDQGNPFRKKPENPSLDRNSKFRKNRIVTMWEELQKLHFSIAELNAMQNALEDERIRRKNCNKMIRYCEENKLDLDSARQKMLERKERELVKYRAEKEIRKKMSGWIDREKCSSDSKSRNRSPPVRNRQKAKRKKGDPRIVYTSRAILADESPQRNSNSHGHNKSMSNESSHQRERLFDGGRDRSRSPNQRFGGMRGARSRSPPNQGFRTRRERSRSPLNQNRRDDDFIGVRRRNDSHERYISPHSAFSDKHAIEKSYNLNKSKTPADKYKFAVQIVNRSDPFGGINEGYQPVLLNAVFNCLQVERFNGSHWIEVDQCLYKNRILHVSCINDDTISCLEHNVRFFNELLPGADLYVSRKLLKFDYKRVSTFLNNYILTTEEFFQIIKKQNDYPTEVWREYHRSGDKQNISIMLGIDPGSYERLARDNGFAYFFMGRLLFNMNLK